MVKEVNFSEDDDRFERDIEGSWVACGINPTLLFARWDRNESIYGFRAGLKLYLLLSGCKGAATAINVAFANTTK